MPDVARPNAQPWDVTIPLFGGGQAILRIPIPLSKADFDLVKSMVNSNLDAAEKAITKPDLKDAFSGIKLGTLPGKAVQD